MKFGLNNLKQNLTEIKEPQVFIRVLKRVITVGDKKVTIVPSPSFKG